VESSGCGYPYVLNGIIGSLRESNDENGSQVSSCYAAQKLIASQVGGRGSFTTRGTSQAFRTYGGRYVLSEGMKTSRGITFLILFSVWCIMKKSILLKITAAHLYLFRRQCALYFRVVGLLFNTAKRTPIETELAFHAVFIE